MKNHTTDPEPEDLDDYDYVTDFGACEICGLTEDHSLDCPHDDSPFGNLIREGFD